MRSSLQTALLFGALALVGASAWTLKLAGNLEVDTRELAQLAPSLGSWSSEDVPVDDDVARMLRADFNVQRAYRHSLGDVVFLYVGYYGTARGGRPEHTPWVCYPSTGWEILASRVVSVDAASGLAPTSSSSRARASGASCCSGTAPGRAPGSRAASA